MKRIIYFGILAALSLTACQQENFEPIEDLVFSATIEEFGGLTKTSLNSANSVVWSENDEIAIFQGWTLPSQFRVLSSSVGSTTASFDEISSNQRGDAISANVAMYPYDNLLECEFVQDSEGGNAYVINNVLFPDEQAYVKESFANESFMMVAVTRNLKDKKLKFRNVSGALRLKIKGDVTVKRITIKGNSGEILAGDASVTAYSDGSDPSVKMQKGGSQTVVLNCGSGVALNNSTATEFIIALPPTVFDNGFTVTVTDSRGASSEHRTEKSNAVNRSKILNMPEIVFGENAGELEPEGCTDISEQGTANCYIVSKPGDYKFPTVKGNGTESVGSVRSVEVLWESFGTSVSPEPGELISEVAYSGGYVLFRTPSSLREGNAVIAAKNASGKILWSWHIWLTDKPEEHKYANGAGTLMDRNLGATSATPGNVGALGLLYQWGRKDPFLGSSVILSSGVKLSQSSRAASSTSWPSYIKSDSNTGTIEYTLRNPMQFVFSNDDSKDWYYAGSASTPSKRWNDEAKTIYDPCPAGWMVPYGGSSGFWAAAGIPYQLTLDKSLGGYKFPTSVSGVEAWYPCVGYDGGALSNSLDVNGVSQNMQCGYYWTSTTYASDYLHYQLALNASDNVSVLSYENGKWGQAIRCYKEGSSDYNDASSNATDLNEDGETANSYIVSESGKYMFKPVKGNTSTSVGTISSVSVLWESYGTSTTPAKGSLVKSVEYVDGKIVFTVPDDFRKGNAVIAAKNSSGKILWSWHIWLTDTPAEHTYYGSNITMDRNLGATSSATSSVGALGLLYQWGRKDPFLGSSSISSDVLAKSVGESWPSAVNSSSSTGTISYVTAHPMQFVLGTTYTDDDWLYSYRDDTLWGETKTQYDPCPPGWRVPSYMIWLNAGFLTEEFNSSTRGATFSISNPSTTWYPASGASFGDYLIETGTSGCYWSCNLQKSSPIFMHLTDDPNSQDTYYLLNRHFACSIRCMKD